MEDAQGGGRSGAGGEGRGVDEEGSRGPDTAKETWVEWVKRVTRAAQKELLKARIGDWIEQQRLRKWRWAGHVARRSDNRWSTISVSWQPGVGGPSYRVLDIIGTGGFISDHTFPPVDLEYDTGWGFSTGRISVHSGFG